MFRFVFLLLALSFASAVSASEGPRLFVDAPRDGYLNLRTGPSTGYHVLEKMEHGSKVTLIAKPGTWAKVYHHETDTIGWAHGRFLSHDKPHQPKPHHPKPPQYSDGQRWVDAPYGDLNLRKGPGTDYHVLRKIHNGMKVDVLGKSGKWRLVKLKSGLIGWAHKAYLTKQRPDRPRPAPQPQPKPYSDLQAAFDACEHNYGRAFRHCMAQRLPRR
ncbi:MAG: SH3 domain-containing protein [Pelagimonas sp.]|uniref:SH3 domain-containing protein n=1 Tax=Pelagimonas sp. TaxID=2073170 RepID=UPI003D6BD4E2